VDSTIDEITVLLGVTRDSLNIVASTKGLIYGNLIYEENNGKIINCFTSGLEISQGQPVPKHINTISNLKSDAKFILIIEKETVFYKLISEKFCEILGPSILITVFFIDFQAFFHRDEVTQIIIPDQ